MTILVLKKVTYELAKEKKQILKCISINFSEGKTYCILGKNSREKGSLVSLLSGFEQCTSGSIMFEEMLLNRLNREKYRRVNVGMVLQKNNFLTQFSIVDNLKLCADSFRKSEREGYQLLKSVGLDEHLANIEVKKLSLLDQQKACLAKAIANNPKVIIVEEPLHSLSELPLKKAINFLENYAKKNNACIIIFSKTNIATEYAHEIWGLNVGRLIFIKEK